jgi:polar amino acid transport system permease protein
LHAVWPFIPYLLRGFVVTIQLSALATALMIPAAFALGLCRRSDRWYLWRPAAFIVEFFRGSSALVQLFWAFYALPLLGVRLSPLLVAILVLGLNEAAYSSEAVRASLKTVSDGQLEAAKSIGLSPVRTFFTVTLPQALPVLIPSMGNAIIGMTRLTALASLVTVQELTFRAQNVVTTTTKSTAVYTIALVLYLALSLVLAGLIRLVETWVSRHYGFSKSAEAAARATSAAVSQTVLAP